MEPVGGLPAQTPRRAGAAKLLAGRILAHARPVDSAELPRLIDDGASGLVLAGAGARAAARQCREHGYGGVLLIDPAAYENHAATADEPFQRPAADLFGTSLRELVADQFAVGADAALTPTGWIRAGDAATVRSLAEQVASLGRDDVVASVPLDSGWLEAGLADMAVDLITRIKAPKAVFIEGQFNPPERVAGGVANLRTLVGAVDGAALFRTDLAAFDAVAHGALAGSIGTASGLRHFVRPGHRAFYGKPKQGQPADRSPSVLAADLVRFVRGSTLAEHFGETPAPFCSCAVCGQRRITSFVREDDRKAARLHGVAVWTEWLSGLTGQVSPRDRQRYWRNVCRHGITMHEAYNRWANRPDGLVPPAPLRIWAAGEPQPPAAARSRRRSR